MSVISKECGYSFAHFTKGKGYDDLLVGVDDDYIDYIRDIAAPLVEKFGGGKPMAQALVVQSLCIFHLFRIQRESDELAN